jgi:Chaperone of endosialidase
MCRKRIFWGFGVVLSLLVLPISVSAQEVLWDQTAGAQSVIDQDFETAFDANDVFLTDDFTNSVAWNISAIFTAGTTSVLDSLINASALHWQIYADSGGVPDGNPSGSGNPPLWSVSLPPTDPQVLIAGSNVTLSLPRPLHLEPGTYWLFFYPSLNSGSYGAYYWHTSTSTNGYIAKWINPGNGYGYGTLIDISPTMVIPQDLAFRLEGITGPSIISPTGGESLPSGSIYEIQWAGRPGAEYFRLSYSMDKGTTWKQLANQYADSNFNWWLPTPPKNMSKCLMKVEGFNAKGALASSDISEQTFSIDVVKLTSPNGAETFTSGSNPPITWETNGTKKPVSRVKLFYTLNGGIEWKPIATLSENLGVYNEWLVPDVTKDKTSCKVKVVLKDASGNVVGSDVSDEDFTITPNYPSDRNLKENITLLDGRDILSYLAAIPVFSWNYKSQDPSIRHIGPMAQDFRAAFGVGENERSISTVDAHGISLAAIQGLYKLMQEKEQEIRGLKRENTELRGEIRDIVKRLAAIE